MPEQSSALAEVYRVGRLGAAGDATAPLTIFERLGRHLVQVSGWPGEFDPVCRELEALLSCPVPRDCREASQRGDRAIFRVGPERLWLTGPLSDGALRGLDAGTFGVGAVVTELGQSRTLVRVQGSGSRALLNRGLPVDLDDAVFGAGSFAQSVIHHVPVLVHRADAEDAFDVYVAREFAVSLWEWLTEAAQSIGCRVAEGQYSDAQH